jgi:hypothetical protein
VKRKSEILGRLATWYSRVIFVGLVFWGFVLYMENEWVMVKWPW